MWLDSSGLVACIYEHTNEFSVSINRGKFHIKMSTKDPAESSEWSTDYKCDNSQLHSSNETSTGTFYIVFMWQECLRTLVNISKRIKESSRQAVDVCKPN
jgi:hypothetical protein